MLLIRRRAVALVVIIPVLTGMIAVAQQPRTRFDVASIKPSAPGVTGGITRPVNGTLRATGATVTTLIWYAFDVMPVVRRDPRPVGGPAWLDEERYDIVARGVPDLTFPESRQALRSLLEERFKLRVRIEKRDMPVYALVVARSDGTLGRGMTRSAMDCSLYSRVLAETGIAARAREAGPGCGISNGVPADLAGLLGLPPRAGPGGTATIAELLPVIMRSPEVDRAVVDATGLTGTFDFNLSWTPTALAATGGDAASIFTTLRDNLGFRLEPRSMLRDAVVIESIERPTED